MPRIIDKKAKKAEILHAAMQVFAEKGVGRTKMADIAVAAGIGKGTIYEYFRSKEEIFAEAFRLVSEQTLQLMNQALHQSTDAETKLYRLLDISLVEFMEHGEHFIEIMMDFWAEGVRKHDHTMMQMVNLKSLYEGYRQAVARVLEQGIQEGQFRPMDVQLNASLLIAALDGLMLQWTLDRSLFTFRKAGRVLLHSFLYGIRQSRDKEKNHET